MDTNKNCPLCGKEISEDQHFCDDCNDHIKHQYETDFLSEGLPEPAIRSTYSENILDEEVIADNQSSKVLDDSDVPLSAIVAKKKMSKGVIFILVGCVVLVLVGAIGSFKVMQKRQSEENEQQFWNNSLAENTILSYSKYLVTYKDGRFAEEAYKRIDEIKQAEIDAWKKLKKSSDINVFYSYISDNPDTPHMDEIRNIMDSLSWLSARKDSTADSFKAYLENVKLGNISGKHVDAAKKNYDYLSSIVVLNEAELSDLQIDLNDFFNKLADGNPKVLLKKFAPTVLYYKNKTSATDLVSQIVNKRKTDKIKKINYTIVDGSVYAKKDNQDIVFVELSVEELTSYQVRKKKDEKKTLKLKMELEKDKQIRLMGDKK